MKVKGMSLGLVSLLVTVTKYLTNAADGRKDLFWLTVQSIIAGSHGSKNIASIVRNKRRGVGRGRLVFSPHPPS